ncbi:type II toxin-antitoxin system VapC family toxin [Azospirillum canadense]|uniref:type II toxin-antitoxin system VapC family toxin n=1 Tax=Azospirillum canadense TaxID=403962 RepID=UPI002227F86B|nr:PIN domain nuclease [Azospirillum canadense]MCW2243161.1 putative nucleic acid-binding protein [Azospirillum canadense]
MDTTVWVDFFRRADTPQVRKLKALVGRGLILVGDIVLLEVLQGVRDDAEARRVEQALRTHAVQAMLSPTAAPKVAANDRALRAKGITVWKIIDMLIGTFCIDGGHVLLHNDKDFEPMRQNLGLRVL